MGVFHCLYNAPVEIYVKDLEDEVMTLRAQLQILRNDNKKINNDWHVEHTLAQSRLADNEELCRQIAELNKALENADKFYSDFRNAEINSLC